MRCSLFFCGRMIMSINSEDVFLAILSLLILSSSHDAAVFPALFMFNSDNRYRPNKNCETKKLKPVFRGNTGFKSER